MSCGCDRPYPYFKADIEKISYLSEHGWCQVDLGLMFIAYDSIQTIYDLSKALISDKNGTWKAKMTPKEKHLQTALLNYYHRCLNAHYVVDMEQWRSEEPKPKPKKKERKRKSEYGNKN